MIIKFKDILYVKGRIGWQALKKDEYLLKGDYYLVTGVNIKDDYSIDYKSCYFVSKERYEQDAAIQLKIGDIILTKDGTIGKIGLISNLDKPATLNSHLFLIRNLRPDILNTKYLFYLLQSDKFNKYSSNNTYGSNIPAFTQKSFTEYETELPPLFKQEKIAQILDSLDAQIRRNNEMVQKLQVLNQAIFNFHFSNFKKHKVMLKEIAKIYQPETITTNELIKDGKYFVYGSGGIIGKYNQFNHKESELMISCRGLCGNISFSLPYSWIIGNQMVIKPYDNKLKYYLYNYMQIIDLKKIETGSVQKQITRTNLEKLDIELLDDDVLAKINQLLNPIFKQLLSIILFNNKLLVIKQKLMPLLINGQLQ